MNSRYIAGAFRHDEKKSFRIHEIPIRADGIEITTSGLNLYPLVSSSKNLNSPALDAGSGADFLLLLMIFLIQGPLNKYLFVTSASSVSL